jgi:cyclic-di-GMP phosphodiesterase TipF (flagellum assembly factor)
LRYLDLPPKDPIRTPMSVLSQIALIITYTLIAAAIFVVPDVFTSVDPVRASLIAVFVFLLGALVHEVMARRARQDSLARRLAVARRELADIKAELAKSREDAKRVAEAIDRAPIPAGEARAVDAAVAEVKALQTMIDRLGEKPGTPAGPRQGLAAVMPSDRPAAALDADAAETLEQARDALTRGRVDLYLQPIVSLPQRKVRFYECFPRLRAADGASLQPQQYAEAAEKAGQGSAIDNLLLFRTVQMARKVPCERPDAGFVCNVSRTSLEDSAFLGELTALVRDHPDLAARLVLEFEQAALAAQDAATGEALARLAALGVRFSVDHVDNLRLDAPTLSRQGVRFVKIAAKALLSELRLPQPSIDPRAIKDGLDRAGIDLVVDGVESESDLIELIDFQADFGQGFLFGEQRIAKESH